MSQHIHSYRNSKQISPPATVLAYRRMSPGIAEFVLSDRTTWRRTAVLHEYVDPYEYPFGDGLYWVRYDEWERLQ